MEPGPSCVHRMLLSMGMQCVQNCCCNKDFCFASCVASGVDGASYLHLLEASCSRVEMFVGVFIPQNSASRVDLLRFFFIAPVEFQFLLSVPISPANEGWKTAFVGPLREIKEKILTTSTVWRMSHFIWSSDSLIVFFSKSCTLLIISTSCKTKRITSHHKWKLSIRSVITAHFCTQHAKESEELFVTCLICFCSWCNLLCKGTGKIRTPLCRSRTIVF